MSVQRFVVSLVLAIIVATPATAQVSGFVESQNQFLTDSDTSLWFSIQGPLTKDERPWGWWARAYVTRGYSNAYVGFSFKPVDWLQVGTAAGMESGENAYRIGSFLWAGTGRWSFLALHETGTSKPWWRIVGNADIGPFGIGIQNETPYGTGPRAEVRLGREELFTTIWAAGLWDTNGNATLQIGVRLGFK